MKGDEQAVIVILWFVLINLITVSLNFLDFKIKSVTSIIKIFFNKLWVHKSLGCIKKNMRPRVVELGISNPPNMYKKIYIYAYITNKIMA